MEPMRSCAISEQRRVDILMLSDLRFPGGTSHSLAAEIAAQAQVGWSTGLVHMNGPLVSWLRPVNPNIREQIRRSRARLFVGDRPIRTKLVVVRHPAVLQAAFDQLPPIETEHLVLVANAHRRTSTVTGITDLRRLIGSPGSGLALLQSGRRSGHWYAKQSPLSSLQDCANRTG
jgi:hypothetical protein